MSDFFAVAVSVQQQLFPAVVVIVDVDVDVVPWKERGNTEWKALKDTQPPCVIQPFSEVASGRKNYQPARDIH